MEKLTMEQIKALELNAKVIALDGLTGDRIGQYRLFSKGVHTCVLIKEDKFECILKGQNTFLTENVDILTYWLMRNNSLELYEALTTTENEKEKFFEELVNVLNENIQYIHPELRECLKMLATTITEAFFKEVEEYNIQGEVVEFCCDSTGAIDGLNIEYSLCTKEWKIYFETEKEMSYSSAMTYLTNLDKKFRIESAIMDDLIETAIAYEDEWSLSDEDLDSLDNFLNYFLQEDYSSMFDIIKFITFYGKPEDMQELIENGRWFMKKC